MSLSCCILFNASHLESFSLDWDVALQLFNFCSEFLLSLILLFDFVSDTCDLSAHWWVGRCGSSSIVSSSLGNTLHALLVNLILTLFNCVSKLRDLWLSSEEFLLLNDASWWENALTDILGVVLYSLKRVLGINGQISLPNVSVIVSKYWIQLHVLIRWSTSHSNFASKWIESIVGSTISSEEWIVRALLSVWSPLDVGHVDGISCYSLVSHTAGVTHIDSWTIADKSIMYLP